MVKQKILDKIYFIKVLLKTSKKLVVPKVKKIERKPDC